MHICYLMKTLQELYESDFWNVIGRRILGKQGDEMKRRIFYATWGSEGRFFGNERETKWLDFLEDKKGWLDFDFGVL